MSLLKGKKALVSLNNVVLKMSHCICPLLHSKTNEISIFDVVTKILSASGVDDWVDIKEDGIKLPSLGYGIIYGCLTGARASRCRAVALTYPDFKVLPPI